ncbi:UDP-glycosyltransferase 85A8-like [Papaver somniferum]|uniref:UDP-glycosyltransferase 85A8-like n=1 Tax=Papaver somniferum TaxID=3469 RepID=UPI000E6F4691|nr:UDP-glycosyltransferase 85A8-like [Papaver somniferum]
MEVLDCHCHIFTQLVLSSYINQIPQNETLYRIKSVKEDIKCVNWLDSKEPNSFVYLCNEWGVGMEIDSNVKMDEVARLVRELMEGEKGNKMRNKAMEWKKKAEEATSAGGSSYATSDKIINEILVRKIKYQ